MTFAGSWASEAERERILATVGRLGLSDSAHFPGVVRGREKARLFEAADVYLLPSFGEGQPVSIIEAMAYALPVISTRVGAVPDTVADEETGILVSPGDGDGLAVAMTRLVDDPDLRVAMGKAGRARYVGLFSLERSHEVLRDHLVRLARRRGLRSG